MKASELLSFLQNIGKDPSRLVFEDDLTGIYNRRFFLNYLEYRVEWDQLHEHPVSLLMMDLDHFKQVNDTYGHHVGDQALILVAKILKEVAGEENFPIRYAGDEFMILMPEGEKIVALQTAENLLRRIQREPLRIAIAGKEGRVIPLSLSIGVATAPEDAKTGRGLIQKADIALYFAKKEGRNRLANASDVPPEGVFVKTALHQLEAEKTVGRRSQLNQVLDSFKEFGEGRSQFLLIVGTFGMGKSSFLETICRNLLWNKSLRHIKVKLNPPEMFHPYYLVTRIIAELLNQHEDKGFRVLDSLDPKELMHLSYIMPELGAPGEPKTEDSFRFIRESLFNTLLYFIPKAADSNSLILIIDDMNWADEASLLLLRHLILKEKIQLFICGTTLEPSQLRQHERPPPLVSFVQTYRHELGIREIELTPLTVADIGEHLREIFPQINLPEIFEKDLERITNGNPLFLAEIVRKLVLDQKIVLTGQRWILKPLDESYLPKSFEALIDEKIAALDEESRQLLRQVSAFGEDVSLSQFVATFQQKEAEILELLDRAVSLGLIRSEFSSNDEKIRFLSKRIQELTGSTLHDKEKQRLHDRIGSYQETLFKRRLLPSPAIIAYYFRHSSNPERADAYETIQVQHNQRVFSPLEAIRYTGERRKEVPPPGTPLDPESLAQVPSVLRLMMTALRNLKLYPPGSEPVTTANRQVKESLDSILERNKSLTIFQVGQALMVNGQRMDTSEIKWIAEELQKLFDRAELKGLIFHHGVTEEEIRSLLEGLSRVKPRMITRDYWRRFSEENNLSNIELKQVRYTITVESDAATAGFASEPASVVFRHRDVSPDLLAREQKLEPEDMKLVPDILRALLNLSKNVKLYPLHSKTLSASIDQCMEAIGAVLMKYPVLTLARVGDSLVVNAAKVDTSGIDALVEGFLNFMGSVMLTSITFMETLTSSELKHFVEILSRYPAHTIPEEFWSRSAVVHQLRSILLNRVIYETRISYESESLDREDILEGDSEPVVEPIAREDYAPFLKSFPARLTDLLIAENDREAKIAVSRLFSGFQKRPTMDREKAIECARILLEDLTVALQRRFSMLLHKPLVEVFRSEKDPRILREIAALLHRMGTVLVQFSDYGPASQIFLALHARYRELEETKDPHIQRLAKVLDWKLEPAAQKLLLEDLRSSNPAQRESASLVLGSLGRAAAPFLIDVIKKVEDLRTRQLAAQLLREIGAEAASLLKREFRLESSPEERQRILEVIDTVTRDLSAELAYALGDQDQTVRQAGFKLAERLNDIEAVELLVDFARRAEKSIAIGAIESLGRIKLPIALESLHSLLKDSKDHDKLIACCRALAQIGDPTSIEPLARILARRGYLFRRPKRLADVKAAAASALSNINHWKVADVLSGYVGDQDPRIRKIARSVVYPEVLASAGKVSKNARADQNDGEKDIS